MPDIGEVKAKVTIEYDGSGLEQARKDLASLGDLTGSAGEGTGGVGQALAELNGQFEEVAKGAKSASDSIGAFEKSSDSGATALSEMNDVLDESQRNLADTATAFEDLQKPIEAASRQLQDIGVTTDYSAANMGVFHDMLSDPAPFDMLSGYLESTGQSQQDFTASIGDSNTSMLEQMARTSDVTHEALGGVTASFQEASRASEGFAKAGGMATDAMAGMGPGWLAGITGLPADEAWAKIDQINQATSGAGKAAGAVESIGLGEGISGTFGAITEGLNAIAMPLFAVQMIGMVVGQVATGIYDMAATAEGPAAHGVGTFTGTVDALGQSAAKAGQAFSENFGQGILPTLQAINYESSQGGPSGLGAFGSFLGGTVSTIANLGSLLFGIGTGNTGLIKGGYEGLVNQFDQLTGQPLQYTGPGPESQAQTQATQQRGQLLQTVQAQAMQTQTQGMTYLEQAVNTDYLQQQDYAQAAQQFYQRKQQIYNQQHPISQAQLQADASYQDFAQQEARAMQGGPLPYTPGSWTGPAPGTPAMQSVFGSTFGVEPLPTISSLSQGLGGGLGIGAGAGINLAPKITWSADGLEHTFTGKASWIGEALENLFTGKASWLGVGLTNIFEGKASWIGQGLTNLFTGQASWLGVGLTNIFEGQASWIGEGLENLFTGKASWVGDGLENLFTGKASWLGIGLTNIFEGKASWIGEGLEHTFTGVANWIGQNLTPTFTVSPSFMGLGFFAAGGSDLPAGWRVVGEDGPELQYSPGGDTIIPNGVNPFTLGTSYSPISLGSGGMGGGAPQSVNVIVQLDSTAIISAMGLPMAATIRASLGSRSA